MFFFIFSWFLASSDRSTPIMIDLNLPVPVHVLYLRAGGCYNDCGLRLDIRGCVHDPQGLYIVVQSDHL